MRAHLVGDVPLDGTRIRQGVGAAVVLTALAFVALWLTGTGYLLCLRLGPLWTLRAVEVSWRGHTIGHWDDPSRLRQFRATLPRYVEEMGGSKCGDGSVTTLRLMTASRTIQLALPVDQCSAINGGQGSRSFSFEAPETLRLISTWIAEDPSRLEHLRQQCGDGTSRGENTYSHLTEQLTWWRHPPAPGRRW